MKQERNRLAKKLCYLCFVAVIALGLMAMGCDRCSNTKPSNVQITNIFYDGRVYRTESDEYVEITNLGDEAQDLDGWVLKDIADGGPSFTFPSHDLKPGKSIRVYTNEIHPKWGGFSFGCEGAVWNNKEPDIAALYNDQEKEVSRKSY